MNAMTSYLTEHNHMTTGTRTGTVRTGLLHRSIARTCCAVRYVLHIDKGTTSTPSAFQQLCLRRTSPSMSSICGPPSVLVRSNGMSGCCSFFAKQRVQQRSCRRETVSAVVVSSKDERSRSITYPHRINNYVYTTVPHSPFYRKHIQYG
jgi:hypothetical protein